MNDRTLTDRLKHIPQAVCIPWIKCVLFSFAILGAICSPTEQSLIFSYDDSTPFPDAIKCFTCSKRSTNEECNRKAYDAFCPSGTKYCYTMHHLYPVSQESILVTKQCAKEGVCNPDAVGCFYSSEEQKVCISCCEGSKCNLGVPTNETNAIFATITPFNHSSRQAHSNIILLWLMLSIAYVFRLLT